MSEQQDSIWGQYETLSLSSHLKEAVTDIVVVGAGVAGLTTAYVLAQAGLRPLVIEAHAVGAGMTGRSTAHISAAVDNGWRKMAPYLGAACTSDLAGAYRQGIEMIGELAAALPGGCDFAWVDGELMARTKDQETLEAEYRAASAAGLEVTPIQRARAAEELWSISFARQGKLHPLKYVDGLARTLAGQGVELVRAQLKGFQRTARGIELVMRDDQRIVARRAVVLAYNLALDVRYPGVEFSRRRSYVVAAACPDDTVADTITWDLARPYHYTRLVENRGRRFLLAGGADHSAEDNAEPGKRFDMVEAWMRKRFPSADAVEYRWHGDLKQTSDSFALLGRLPGFENVYVLDGDTGLGFNHAMIGAQIVRDGILGRENPVAALFTPERRPLAVSRAAGFSAQFASL